MVNIAIMAASLAPAIDLSSPHTFINASISSGEISRPANSVEDFTLSTDFAFVESSVVINPIFHEVANNPRRALSARLIVAGL